jgi:hypothetical protein
VGRETTSAADDAENPHSIRSRRNALPADTDRVQPCEDTVGTRKLLETSFLIQLLFFLSLK